MEEYLRKINIVIAASQHKMDKLSSTRESLIKIVKSKNAKKDFCGGAGSLEQFGQIETEWEGCGKYLGHLSALRGNMAVLLTKSGISDELMMSLRIVCAIAKQTENADLKSLSKKFKKYRSVSAVEIPREIAIYAGVCKAEPSDIVQRVEELGRRLPLDLEWVTKAFIGSIYEQAWKSHCV